MPLLLCSFPCLSSIVYHLYCSLSVHIRKLPAHLTFWSSSLVQGPFTSSGLSTFCQRCWHWPSVLPCNTATQNATHYTRTTAHWSLLPNTCTAAGTISCKFKQIHTGKWLAMDFQESVPCCSTSFFSFSSWKGQSKKHVNMLSFTIVKMLAAHK